MSEFQQLAAVCTPQDSERVQDWAAAQFADPEDAALARELIGALLASLHTEIPGERVDVHVSPHPRMVRLVVYGPTVLSARVVKTPEWGPIRRHATVGSVAPCWTGVWCEMPLTAAVASGATGPP